MNCYACKWRRDVPGDCHSQCGNAGAKVESNPHGVINGWCWWPLNFDPIWIESCTGFEQKEEV